MDIIQQFSSKFKLIITLLISTILIYVIFSYTGSIRLYLPSLLPYAVKNLNSLQSLSVRIVMNLSTVTPSLVHVVANLSGFVPPVNHVVVNLSSLHQNIMFTSDKVYFLNGVAYDFYSVDELDNRSRPAPQWQTFPLPDEHLSTNVTPWIPIHNFTKQTTSFHVTTPLKTTTGLAFVDRIYIISIPSLKDRHANLERAFARYQLTNYEWYMKWTYDTCNAPENREEVLRKLNLRGKYIGINIRKRQCSLSMKHVDIWHDIVARNSSLSLILEDDAVFVPSFREKFDRAIYTAVRTGALKMGGLKCCVNNKIHLSQNSSEWFEQDPVIVIGTCLKIYDPAFAKHRRDAQPMLSTHKSGTSRCSHGYLLTACSAQALLRQIAVTKKISLPIDIVLNEKVAASPTLQSFWLDPPIVYQGNQITDLDGIPSFKRRTY